MEFWLSYNNFAERLQLPVNPSEYTINKSSKNETIDVVGLGEVSRFGGDALATIDINSFLPKYVAPYTTSTVPDTYPTIDILDSWRTSQKPIRLIITDTNINLPCTIDSLSYGESGGNREINYSLSLKEYRFIAAKQIAQTPINTPVPAAAAAAQRPDAKEQAKTYTVKSGDTLYEIAKQLTGSGSNWQDLYDKNKDTIGGNPNLIKPGQVLTI